MTRMPANPAASTRERLLDTAERLFAERGFSGTSVREITEAAEANLGAINYHFRSKADLYAEVFKRRVALVRDPILNVAGETARLTQRSPAEALRAVGQAFLAPHQDRGTSLRLLRLLAREAIEACLPPGLLIREFLVPVIEVIAGIVRRARPDLPEGVVGACAHSFLAQLMHIVKSTGTVKLPVQEPLEHAVRFTVAAVRHIEGRPRKGIGARQTQRKPS